MNPRHAFFEELDAFDRRWRDKYLTLTEAASAAGCREMFADWLNTSDGRRYLAAFEDVPTYLQDVIREQELARSASLPYNLSNLGIVHVKS